MLDKFAVWDFHTTETFSNKMELFPMRRTYLPFSRTISFFIFTFPSAVVSEVSNSYNKLIFPGVVTQKETVIS